MNYLNFIIDKCYNVNVYVNVNDDMTTIAIAADNHDNDDSVIISYLYLQKYFNVRQLTNVNVNVNDDMTTRTTIKNANYLNACFVLFYFRLLQNFAFAALQSSNSSFLQLSSQHVSCKILFLLFVFCSL